MKKIISFCALLTLFASISITAAPAFKIGIVEGFRSGSTSGALYSNYFGFKVGDQRFCFRADGDDFLQSKQYLAIILSSVSNGQEIIVWYDDLVTAPITMLDFANYPKTCHVVKEIAYNAW